MSGQLGHAVTLTAVAVRQFARLVEHEGRAELGWALAAWARIELTAGQPAHALRHASRAVGILQDEVARTMRADVRHILRKAQQILQRAREAGGE